MYVYMYIYMYVYVHVLYVIYTMYIYNSHVYTLTRPTADIPANDYFYNYFHLGLDVLFEAHSHSVKKLQLHTNFLNCYEFHMYVIAGDDKACQ